MSDDDSTTSRRSVLKKASVTAAVGVVAATGSASADHCDCYHDYRCNTDLLCEDPSTDRPYMRQSRECCDCDGDGTYECSDWTNDNVCCSG
jgi:hypothetical protein